MTLTVATLAVSAVLILTGLVLLVRGNGLRPAVLRTLRSRLFDTLAFGAGAAWFLFEVTQLGEADFGRFRGLLFAGFLAVAVVAWMKVPDFLGVRGIAILILMSARHLLDAAYMRYEIPQRLLLVSSVYVAIVIALYLGTVPYRARDWSEWLLAKDRGMRSRILGALTTAFGLLLIGVAVSY